MLLLFMFCTWLIMKLQVFISFGCCLRTTGSPTQSYWNVFMQMFWKITRCTFWVKVQICPQTIFSTFDKWNESLTFIFPHRKSQEQFVSTVRTAGALDPTCLRHQAGGGPEYLNLNGVNSPEAPSPDVTWAGLTLEIQTTAGFYLQTLEATAANSLIPPCVCLREVSYSCHRF